MEKRNAAQQTIFCDECSALRDVQYELQRKRKKAAYESRLRELRYMPYSEYLQTPEWKSKRNEMLRRFGYKCQVCNSPERLNVHHRTYENRGNEQMKDLTVLCESCHRTYHKK